MQATCFFYGDFDLRKICYSYELGLVSCRSQISLKIVNATSEKNNEPQTKILNKHSLPTVKVRGQKYVDKIVRAKVRGRKCVEDKSVWRMEV